LPSLYEITATGEQHAPSDVDQRMVQRARQMTLARAGRPEQQHVGAALQPLVSLGQCPITCALDTLGTGPS